VPTTVGNVFFRHGELAATRPQWERVLAIREKSLGPEHSDVGAALNNLAIIAEQTGDYLIAWAESAEELGRCLAGLSRTPRHSGPGHAVARLLARERQSLLQAGEWRRRPLSAVAARAVGSFHE